MSRGVGNEASGAAIAIPYRPGDTIPAGHTVNDAILTPEDRKEALSRAYVQAVAAAAGYTLARQDFDRDGVDLQVRAGGEMRASLDLQLKATVLLAQDGPEWRFPLRKRNYDLLREPTMVPRALVVLDLPLGEERWVCISDKQLVMRHCAYWLVLEGAPESVNQYTVTVPIPKTNRFDVQGLRALMAKARGGSLS